MDQQRYYKISVLLDLKKNMKIEYADMEKYLDLYLHPNYNIRQLFIDKMLEFGVNEEDSENIWNAFDVVYKNQYYSWHL
jgi:hypothetical protein